MNNFSNDRDYGEKCELAISGYFTNNGWQLEKVPDGIREQYDFLATKDGLTRKWEIKSDRQAARTSNVFVETGNQFGQPAGLLTSEADEYLFFIPALETVYAIPKARLLFLAKDEYAKRVSKPTKGVLIPMHQIESRAIKYDLLEKPTTER